MSDRIIASAAQHRAQEILGKQPVTQAQFAKQFFGLFNEVVGPRLAHMMHEQMLNGVVLSAIRDVLIEAGLTTEEAMQEREKALYTALTTAIAEHAAAQQVVDATGTVPVVEPVVAPAVAKSPLAL